MLSACTDAPLDNKQFRWLTGQEITIAGHTVMAMRLSYAGELGWELHMPTRPVDVYNALTAAGAPLGLTDYGSFAMNVLRWKKRLKALVS